MIVLLVAVALTVFVAGIMAALVLWVIARAGADRGDGQ